MQAKHILGAQPAINICRNGTRAEAMDEQELFGGVGLPGDGEVSWRGRDKAQSHEEYNCRRDSQPSASVVDVAHEIWTGREIMVER